MAKFRYVGTHPQEVVQGDKRPMLAPGGFVNLTPTQVDHPENRGLIEERQLIAVSELKKGGDLKND